MVQPTCCGFGAGALIELGLPPNKTSIDSKQFKLRCKIEDKMETPKAATYLGEHSPDGCHWAVKLAMECMVMEMMGHSEPLDTAFECTAFGEDKEKPRAS